VAAAKIGSRNILPAYENNRGYIKSTAMSTSAHIGTKPQYKRRKLMSANGSPAVHANGEHKSLSPGQNLNIMAADDALPQIGDMRELYVINRHGVRELMQIDKITERIRSLVEQAPRIAKINPAEITLKIAAGLHDDIHTSEIDNYAARYAANEVSDPNYILLAARIVIDSHQKNTLHSFVDKMGQAYKDKHNLISKEFYAYVQKHRAAIESIIKYERDFAFDYFGFMTFLDSYSIKINDIGAKPRAIEQPQDMFMRTAIDIHRGNIDDVFPLAAITETYDALSNHLYTHASPTYYNSGSNTQQYASCFLMGCGDSRQEIMQMANDISQISKFAGGIGAHVHDLRSAGVWIKSTNGRSNGLTPFLSVYDKVAAAFNQGGRRPGSVAIYLMPHHPDFMAFLDLPRRTSTSQHRTSNLFYAVWLPDIFMERVSAGAMWSFFDPCESGVDLSNYWGEEYSRLYLELERQSKFTKQCSAREVWNELYKTNLEIGHPYICFSDNANRANMHSHLGPLKSSNLCSEIMLYSNTLEYAVCILASLALPKYIIATCGAVATATSTSDSDALTTTYTIDYDLLRKTVTIMVTNLNQIIDKTFHPVEQSKRGNTLHRPIGIGVQGFDDMLSQMHIPFESEEARTINWQIFETIYYAAITQSCELARQYYLKLRAQAQSAADGIITVARYSSQSYEPIEMSYTADTLPHNIGAFPSAIFVDNAAGDYEYETSPIMQGKFHWEFYPAAAEHIKTHSRYDWESLRSKIRKFGVRNSHCVALMPTASTSQFLGNSECIEPYMSNIFRRNTKSGDFIITKKPLIRDLYELGIWSPQLKDALLASEGSIQHIEGIPDKIKALYKTAWEIDQRAVVQLAIDRQPFVDQGQSLNLFMRKPDDAMWFELLHMGWKGGLKTGKYYLRSQPAVMPQKFTISPHLQKKAQQYLDSHTYAVTTDSTTVCDSCGA
jgi:ribonucleoside-diphosphate reductase alpha chain